MPAGQGRYTIGGKGTHGCSGYPVVGGEGKVHGCHKTKASARAQQAAIYASEGQTKKADLILQILKSEEEFGKSWVVQENYPGCDGFAVVGDSGIHACFKTRAEAEAAIAAHESDHSGDNNDGTDEMHKKDYSTRQRQDMARRGQAMRDGSFPIANEADLRNAIQSVGRAANYEAARRHIIRRARALGRVDMLPEDWNVRKSDGDKWFDTPFSLKKTL